MLKIFVTQDRKLLIYLIVTQKLDLKPFTNQNKTEGKGLKILTPKQMLKRLPIAFAQVKAGNNSENLLNEIWQIIYSLYQSKEIIKKVYDNLMKLL